MLVIELCNIHFLVLMSFGPFFTSKKYVGGEHNTILPLHNENTVNSFANSTTSFFHSFSRRAKGLFSDVPPEAEELLDVPPDQGLKESYCELLELTYSQRIVAFFMMLLMGVLFLFLALSGASVMIIAAPKKFVFFFTIGNLCSLLSTTFLVGASAQYRAMFSAHRFHAALLYCAAVILTFFFALVWRSSILCLVSACFQIACLLWYCLSFIPFARTAVRLVSSGSYAGGMLLKQWISILWNSAF